MSKTTKAPKVKVDVIVGGSYFAITKITHGSFVKAGGKILRVGGPKIWDMNCQLLDELDQNYDLTVTEAKAGRL